jgi:hypothetical protein
VVVIVAIVVVEVVGVVIVVSPEHLQSLITWLSQVRESQTGPDLDG